MYLARFEVGGDEWIQAAATIDVTGAGDRALGSARWGLVAAQLSAAARIPKATVAHRVSLSRSRVLRETIAVTAPAGLEQDVRAVIARLTRIEGMRGGTLSLPLRREERDGWMERLGPFRFCATAEGFSVADVPLACNFRLADTLDALLADACLGGHELMYQIHVREAEVSPEWVRSARKSMLALRDVPGIRDALVEWQDDLARMLGHASALCEEFLAVDTAGAARSAEHLLTDRFRARYGPLGFPVPVFRFEPDAYQDPLVLGVHSHDLDPLAPVALCSVAEPPAERDRLLAWQPSSRLKDLLAPADDDRDPAESQGASPADDEASLPSPYEGDGPIAFISYKRQDLRRVSGIIRMLQELGVRVWYDRGIPGGAEWDDVIEERLTRARFVMVCASKAAVGSKYVRREVKFADALDVPILPILLEDVAFAHGMGMLLTQYQMLDVRAADFTGRLRSAVSRMW